MVNAKSERLYNEYLLEMEDDNRVLCVSDCIAYGEYCDGLDRHLENGIYTYEDNLKERERWGERYKYIDPDFDWDRDWPDDYIEWLRKQREENEVSV